LIYFFDKLGKARHIAVHDLALTLCPPIENEPLHAGYPPYEDIHQQCVAHNREVMKYVMSNEEIKNRVYGVRVAKLQNYATGANVQPSGHGFMPGQLEGELGNTIEKFRRSGKTRGDSGRRTHDPERVDQLLRSTMTCSSRSKSVRASSMPALLKISTRRFKRCWTD